MTVQLSPSPIAYSSENTPISFEEMPLAWLEPSPLNPRRHFDEQALAELAESIKTHGLLEGLVVRALIEPESGQGDPRYLIIAGERRYRAAKMAGLETVPVRILQGIDDKTHIELALLENLQRQDLDPLEEAAGYKALQEIGYTQTQIAAAVKRSQPAIAKSLGLLGLPEDVQDLVRGGQLSPTHGVALAARYRDFPAVASRLARLAIDRHLTTKELEDGLVEPWTLEREGIIASLGHEALFDKSICLKCPFGAYRAGTWGYCLKPEHFRELNVAAESVRSKTFARQAAIVKEQLKAEGKPDAVVPRLQDLSYGSYENLSHDYTRPPATCTTACPCRGFALDGGGRPVSVCTNPARLKSLKAQQSREDNKGKREDMRRRAKELAAHLDLLAEIGPRELALIVAAALAASVGTQSHRAGILVALQRQQPALTGLKEAIGKGTYGIGEPARAALSAHLNPTEQVKLAVEALILSEMSSEFGDTKLWDWYMGNAADK